MGTCMGLHVHDKMEEMSQKWVLVRNVERENEYEEFDGCEAMGLMEDGMDER